MKKGIPEILLFFCAVIWGFAYVVIALLLVENVTPLQQMSFRFAISSILMCIIFRKELMKITKEAVLLGSLIGVFMFIGFYLQTIAQHYTTPSKCAFITETVVIMVPFLNWVLTKKVPDIFSFIGAILTVIGLGFLSLNGSFGSVNLGDILTLLCAFFFACQLILTARIVKTISPIIITIVQFVFSAIFSTIFVVIERAPLTITSSSLGKLLYLTLVATLICFLFQNVAQKYIHPNKVAIIMSTEALFGTLGAILFFNEKLTGRMIFGGALTLVAVIVVETKLSFLNIKKRSDENTEHVKEFLLEVESYE